MKTKHLSLPVEKLTEDVYKIRMTVHRKRLSIMYHAVFDILYYTVRNLHRRVVNKKRALRSYDMKVIENTNIKLLKIFDIIADRMDIRITLERLEGMGISDIAEILVTGRNFNLENKNF